MKIEKISEVQKEVANEPLFTGNQVLRGAFFGQEAGRDVRFGIVNFSPGSRNHLHRHTSDQILIITEGTGVVATDSEEHTVTAGDVVLIPAGENHWHGAPGDTPMTHITIALTSSKTTQLEH